MDRDRPPLGGLTRQQIVRSEIKKFILALNYSQQATYLLNTEPREKLADYPNIGEIIRFRRKALDSANAVDVEVLNSVYFELGTRFRGHFRAGVELFLVGWEEGSNASLLTSKMLNDKWADWYQPNRKAIEDAMNAAVH